MNTDHVEILEVGRDAVLVEVADSLAALSLAHHVRAARIPVLEVVAGACTVLVDGVQDLSALTEVLSRWVPDVDATPGPLVELPTTYDGADLATVAECWGTDEPGVVDLHQQIEFVAAFCGFAPGFA